MALLTANHSTLSTTSLSRVISSHNAIASLINSTTFASRRAKDQLELRVSYSATFFERTFLKKVGWNEASYYSYEIV